MAEDATEIKMEQPTPVTDDGIKLPKNPKAMRWYYRHRDEILEKKRQQRLEDPEYQAKQKEKEEKKKQREEEKKRKIEDKIKKKAELLGIQPKIPSGMEKTD